MAALATVLAVLAGPTPAAAQRFLGGPACGRERVDIPRPEFFDFDIGIVYTPQGAPLPIL